MIRVSIRIYKEAFPTNRESARLNLSRQLCLRAVEHFGQRRAANRITPATRFNATASPALQPMAAQQAPRRMLRTCPGNYGSRFKFWIATVATLLSRPILRCGTKVCCYQYHVIGAKREVLYGKHKSLLQFAQVNVRDANLY